MALEATGLLSASALEEGRQAICAACGGRGAEAFYQVDRIPTQSCVLLDSQEEAASHPVGDLLLALCRRCGFIQNVRFGPDLVDYSKPTEESQAFSPRFQAFARELAVKLVRHHRLEGRSVLEIGCGKGDFLRLLVEAGIGSGLGIDPGFLPARLDGDVGRAEFIRDWYGQRYVEKTADLVLTRHLLEHVPNVGEFLGWLATSTGATPGAHLFTEVPDVGRVLDEGAFWDIYYEHCSYFTKGSLGRALRAAGMQVEDLELGFEGQYILASGVPSSRPAPHPAEEPVERVAERVARFTQVAARARRRWEDRIGDVVRAGGRVCLWGGGSKAVGFLSSLDVPVDRLVVVDINVHKHHRWLPGVVVEISPPQRLRHEPPDLVIPMNPVYADEIGTDLRAMGLSVPIEPV
jgi:hypothetical protein